MLYKKYIDVMVYIDSRGKVTPKEIQAGYYGEWIKIDKITDSRFMASLKVGGIGVRYTCKINYQGEPRKIYVYDGCGTWFIEADEPEEATIADEY